MRTLLTLALVFRAGIVYGATGAPLSAPDMPGSLSIAPAAPASTSVSSLRRSIDREAVRQATSRIPAASPQPRSDAERSWVRQHPVLTGALVGAASGAVWGYVFCRGACEGDPRPLMLFFGGIGAGIGAGTGALIGR